MNYIIPDRTVGEVETLEPTFDVSASASESKYFQINY